MKRSICDVIVKAVEDYSKIPFKEWCLHWPGQVVLATSSIYWTSEVTKVKENRSKSNRNLYIDKKLNDCSLDKKSRVLFDTLFYYMFKYVADV